MHSPLETQALLLDALPGFLVRVAFAAICGGLVGIERERRGKPAGFRTSILICLGSALYMLVGELMAGSASGVDPSRIAAQVVSGIGFLGAGTILHGRSVVTGLTSAATIWVVAAIGLLVGAGFPVIGLIATLLVLVVLETLARVESRLLGRCGFAKVELALDDPRGPARVAATLILAEQDRRVCKYEFVEAGGALRLAVSYCQSHAAHHRYLAELLEIPGLAAK